MIKQPEDVLEFWFSEQTKSRWFNSTPEFDAITRDHFETTAEALANGPCPNSLWEEDTQSALALIILLDQCPRNMFRGTPKAFTWDPLALSVAERLIDRGGDLDVSVERRHFVYMPFMHAETLTAQNRCVELVGSRLPEDESTLRHAIAHRDVIEQFGRFPHRNKVLGRTSTAAEKAFLNNGGYDPS